MTNLLLRISELIDRCAAGRIAHFSRLTGIKDAAIRAWFNRNEANLTAANIVRICEATGVSADWLLLGDSARTSTVFAPTRTWLAQAVASPEPPRKKTKRDQTIAKPTSACFIVTVPHDYFRMCPLIQPGCHLLIDPNAAVRIGSSIFLTHRDQSLIGRLQILTDGYIVLRFDNPDFPPLPLETRFAILGMVMEMNRRLVSPAG